MNNDYFLDTIVSKEVLEARLDRLDTWHKFITILWLMGYKPVEIARIIGTSRQGVTYIIKQSKMEMGVGG